MEKIMKRCIGALALAAGLAFPGLASGPSNQVLSSVKSEPGARAKVTAIFISVTLPDGTVQNFSLDPAKTEALFFTERSASEMLGRFYDHLPVRKTLPADVLLKRYGSQQGMVLLSGEASLSLSQQSVTTLWTTPNASGVLPAFIMKDPYCMPSGQP
jgi:hypothetical protein